MNSRPVELSPSQLCEQIKLKNERARAQLYKQLEENEMFFFYREAPSEARDVLHELWLDMVRRIEEHKIEHPEQVFAYAHRVARTLVNRRIQQRLRMVPQHRLAA